MTLPECDQCDAAGPLSVIRREIRADGQPGRVWAICDCCSKTALIGPDGRLVKHGT